MVPSAKWRRHWAATFASAPRCAAATPRLRYSERRSLGTEWRRRAASSGRHGSSRLRCLPRLSTSTRRLHQRVRSGKGSGTSAVTSAKSMWISSMRSSSSSGIFSPIKRLRAAQ